MYTVGRKALKTVPRSLNDEETWSDDESPIDNKDNDDDAP